MIKVPTDVISRIEAKTIIGIILEEYESESCINYEEEF
jgi:hypothetical protein